jgi:hypothetical protein
MFKKYLSGAAVLCLALLVVGCGGDGPLGNNAPQGRPDWMKKKEGAQPAPAAPAPAAPAPAPAPAEPEAPPQ